MTEGIGIEEFRDINPVHWAALSKKLWRAQPPLSLRDSYATMPAHMIRAERYERQYARRRPAPRRRPREIYPAMSQDLPGASDSSGQRSGFYSFGFHWLRGLWSLPIARPPAHSQLVTASPPPAQKKMERYATRSKYQPHQGAGELRRRGRGTHAQA